MKDEDLHREFDRYANKEVQVGELPAWMNVKGRVAWYVNQGAYDTMGNAWRDFSTKVHAAKLPVLGPPGDVYVCDPADHEKDGGEKLTTILWMPLKKVSAR